MAMYERITAIGNEGVVTAADFAPLIGNTDHVELDDSVSPFKLEDVNVHDNTVMIRLPDGRMKLPADELAIRIWLS